MREEKRVDLNTTKNLGGIGAILMFIGFVPYIPYIGGLLDLVGLIMIMIAARGLASYYNEGGIFNNALYGVITAIVGAVAFIGVLIFALVGFFSDIGITLGVTSITDWSSFTAVDWQNVFLGSDILKWIGVIFLALFVLFIFVVVSAVFFRKSMKSTARKSGVGLFGTAGTLLLVGAVLTIIIFGLILMWISLLLIAVAFFQLRPQQTQAAPPPPPPMYT
jgi:uncharacterized membrane protein